MFLKSVKLNNIRSYESEEIIFPSGSVLLAGDIGCGKSTILLAIEFALFGAKKGELPAYTLLRHGKKEGSVELRMIIDGREIIAKRVLRRSDEDIKQESGYVIINGVKKEGTSEELRATLLELVGYPKDLIKKGKDLIYRYTVYTPQEEMKKILYESKDVRLDTLRKVFSIDKYKRIMENSRIMTAYLRENKKHLEGFAIDLENKKEESLEMKNEILELDKMIMGITPKLSEIKQAISEKKKSISGIENDIIELNILKRELSVKDASLKYKIEQNNRLKDEIKIMEKQIEELNKHSEGAEMADIGVMAKKIGEKEKELGDADAVYKNSIRKIRELEVKIEECARITKKLQSLETCPLCEQKVDFGHKHSITLRESEKHGSLAAQIRLFKEEESRIDKAKLELKKELDSLLKEEKRIGILKIRLESLNEKSSLRNEKLALKEKIMEEIVSINFKKKELNLKIGRYSDSEEKYKAARKEIDSLLLQERFLELEKAKYETQISSIRKFIAGLEKEIIEKDLAKEKLAYILQLVNWLSEMFSNLMSSMERHVMANVHSQFNGLFRNWFDVIMEDESISVKIDEDFTPIIEQDGYETYIESLSGGEKTSVALSYRLALNKVVNDIVVGIKTKDIIMLDEPTDGFSAEQLDKVRDVLRQLNMGQIIIVSHEGKIESFVDNIIRIHKQDNVSGVG